MGHLNNAKDEIAEYQKTIHSLNHDIIHNIKTLKNSQPAQKNSRHSNTNNHDNIDYKDKLQKAQKKYDELLRESEKYRNDREQLLEQQIEYENLNRDTLKYEKRNKLLSDQIVELTYNNVQLEKEINDYSQELAQQNETIHFLQTENQKLMTKQLSNAQNAIITEPTMNSEPNKLSKKRLYSSYGGPDSTLNVFVQNKQHNDLKRRLSVQLRDNFGYNSKLVMFANNIDENGSIDGKSVDYKNETDGNETVEVIDEEQNDLFTMVQSYENNEDYLRNAEDAKSVRSIDEESLSDLSDKKAVEQEIKENSPKIANKSRQEQAIKNGKKTQRYKLRKKSIYSSKRNQDALEEYLHLTASAVKINYPTINATSKELIGMVKTLPFYQAHDHLNRYMMDRLRWEQIQQNKLLQLKAAAIQSQRDHAINQQSTVTRMFKKWFTTEYDNVDDIIFDKNEGAKLKENFRVNGGVGKAQMKSTKSGGTSVNLGSLSPNGMPPKGIQQQQKRKRPVSKHYRNGSNSSDSQRKRRKKRQKQLKSLATTQTMSSSKMNDK